MSEPRSSSGERQEAADGNEATRGEGRWPWRYVYRAMDQYGQIIDVYVSVRRDAQAARRFFAAALGSSWGAGLRW